MEDKDIHNFLESIPPRHRSKLIRMAFRNYIRKTQDESISSENVNVENENADKQNEHIEISYLFKTKQIYYKNGKD